MFRAHATWSSHSHAESGGAVLRGDRRSEAEPQMKRALPDGSALIFLLHAKLALPVLAGRRVGVLLALLGLVAAATLAAFRLLATLTLTASLARTFALARSAGSIVAALDVGLSAATLAWTFALGWSAGSVVAALIVGFSAATLALHFTLAAASLIFCGCALIGSSAISRTLDRSLGLGAGHAGSTDRRILAGTSPRGQVGFASTLALVGVRLVAVFVILVGRLVVGF